MTAAEPDPSLVGALREEDHSPEADAIEGMEAYVRRPEGVAAMTYSYTYIEKRPGIVATARNWNTSQKIATKW